MFSPRRWRAWQVAHWSSVVAALPSEASRHSATPRVLHHISVQLRPLSVHVLHPSNQVVQPASMQLPHWSRPGLSYGQGGPQVPGASIIIAIVLTHSSSGAQRLCMLGGIMPPQLEPAGENAAHVWADMRAAEDEAAARAVAGKFARALIIALALETDALEREVRAAHPEFRYIDLEVM